MRENADPGLTLLFVQSLLDTDFIVRGEAFLALSKIVPDPRLLPEVRDYMSREEHPFGKSCIEDVFRRE